MDPNQALTALRDVLRRWNDGEESDVDALIEVTEQFTAIDDWLSSGGFLPNDWLNH